MNTNGSNQVTDRSFLKPRQIWMTGHTTSDVSDTSYARQFLAEMRQLFRDDTIQISWLGDKDAERVCPEAEVSPTELADIYSRGGIALSDTQGEMFDGGITWRKMPHSKARAFIRNMGYQQNRISLEMPEQSLRAPDFLARFMLAIERMSQLFSVNYLYVWDRLEQDGIFSTRAGLSAGLKDIYWINIFGRAYVDMIGRDTMLQCSAYEIREIGQDLILMRTSDAPPDTHCPEHARLLTKIRSELGARFFTKQIPGTPQEKSGLIGWLEFARVLWRGHREFIDTSWHAAECPEFTWEGVFEP